MKNDIFSFALQGELYSVYRLSSIFEYLEKDQFSKSLSFAGFIDRGELMKLINLKNL